MTNFELIEGETYYSKIDGKIIKGKLDKILVEESTNELKKISFKSLSNKGSWKIYSDEIYLTRDEAKTGGLK